MKKIVLLATIIIISIAGIAQSGIQVGGNLATSKLEYQDMGVKVSKDNNIKFGFLLGLVTEVPITSSFSFRPEFNFIQKGYKSKEIIMAQKYSEEVSLTYFELPLNLVYNVVAGAGNIFFGAGPTVALGIAGKEKIKQPSGLTETVVKFDGKVASDDNLHLKVFDFGGNVLAGYKMTSGLFFTVGYTLGLYNLAPDKGTTYKNHGIGLKIGYAFNGNPKPVTEK